MENVVGQAHVDDKRSRQQLVMGIYERAGQTLSVYRLDLWDRCLRLRISYEVFDKPVRQ